jgi:hypothetical protein
MRQLDEPDMIFRMLEKTPGVFILHPPVQPWQKYQQRKRQPCEVHHPESKAAEDNCNLIAFEPKELNG